MSRRHREIVLQEVPEARHRTFTVREAANLLPLVRADARTSVSGQCARGVVAGLAVARRLPHRWAADDIADPIGHPLEVHQEVGDAIAAAVLPVLTRIAGCYRSHPGQCGAGRRIDSHFRPVLGRLPGS